MIVQEVDGSMKMVPLSEVTPRRYKAADGRVFYRCPGRSDHGKHTKSDARITGASLERLERPKGQVH